MKIADRFCSGREEAVGATVRGDSLHDLFDNYLECRTNSSNELVDLYKLGLKIESF